MLTTGLPIKNRDLDSGSRAVLSEAIEAWLQTNPGILSPFEQIVADQYPDIYDPELTPRGHFER
jgi:hypothetical protein